MWYNVVNMAETKRGTSLEAILRGILTRDRLEIMKRLIEGARDVYELVRAARAQGIYEVLEHATTINLLDPRGDVALIERHQTLRILQDHVAAITDRAWGDGEALAEYRCSPGVPVDCYTDGARHALLISLREIKNRGDVVKMVIHRKMLKSFIRPREWWETEVAHKTRRIQVNIVFPRERRCQGATVTQRSTSKTIALGPQHFQSLVDGRHKLTWTVSKPKLRDLYLLKWSW